LNPTPNRISTWFKVIGATRLADPCCGTGDALRRFANGFGLQYPIETWSAVIGFDAAKYDAGDNGKSVLRRDYRRVWNDDKEA
jgi:hypothetical protein